MAKGGKALIRRKNTYFMMNLILRGHISHSPPRPPSQIRPLFVNSYFELKFIFLELLLFSSAEGCKGLDKLELNYKNKLKIPLCNLILKINDVFL